jgi:Ca-activated chloride channel family protein
MGSPDGTPIPVGRGNGTEDFLRDNDGNTVVTKLDEVTLQKIAAEGRGQYIHSTTSDDGLGTLLNQIGRMEKKTFGTKQFTDYEDRFQYFLGIGLLLLLVESVIGDRKSSWWSKFNISIRK